MIVRKAEKRDIPSLIDLLRQVNLIHHNGRPDLFNIGTKYDEKQLSEIIDDEKRPILVADDGGVKGYAFCVLQSHENDLMLTDIKTLYIDDLCVDENHRREHIGKKLYDAALSLAKALGCYNVTLNVWETNENAKKFYLSCGMGVQKTCLEHILD